MIFKVLPLKFDMIPWWGVALTQPSRSAIAVLARNLRDTIAACSRHFAIGYGVLTQSLPDTFACLRQHFRDATAILSFTTRNTER